MLVADNIGRQLRVPDLGGRRGHRGDFAAPQFGRDCLPRERPVAQPVARNIRSRSR